VTGANKGIGEETAHLLGDQGHPVLLGCRDAQRAANAERQLRDRGIDAHGLHLDVTDPSSLDKAAKRVSDHYGHLDVLVNNAGIASTDAPQVEDIPTALRRLLDTNVIGAVAVIEAMLPLLRQAPAPRIINVSSELGSIACTLDPNSPMWHTPPTSPHQGAATNRSKAALSHRMEAWPWYSYSLNASRFKESLRRAEIVKRPQDAAGHSARPASAHERSPC
jgi:NAD(P)-dependent dehydrogenase (short-subunit alcohol dehydrogenase family)